MNFKVGLFGHAELFWVTIALIAGIFLATVGIARTRVGSDGESSHHECRSARSTRQGPSAPVHVALTPNSLRVDRDHGGLVLALMLVYLALDAIAWVLVAAFFAIALNPAVEALVQRGLGRRERRRSCSSSHSPRWRAGCARDPTARLRDDELRRALPGHLRELDAGRGPLAFLEQRFHLGERLVEIYEKGGIAALVGLERPGASTARAAVDTALALVAVPFLTFFMLLDGKRWVDGALDVLPPGARPRWERVCDGIYRTVGGYVTGNLLISLLAGAVAAVTLMAAGVPYALPLAVIVAILDLVPLVGATAALVVCRRRCRRASSNA